jgi:hypothetical protein
MILYASALPGLSSATTWAKERLAAHNRAKTLKESRVFLVNLAIRLSTAFSPYLMVL